MRVNLQSNHRLSYFGAVRPSRAIVTLDPEHKRHLLAMIATSIATISLVMISILMFKGQL